MSFKYLDISKIDDKIIKIEIKRPEKGNALSRDVLEEFIDAFNSINNEKYVVIITGYGDKYFSAGADVRSLYEGEINVLDFHRYFKVIEDHPYPVIAMINGYCFGAACELAATCDIRIASENSILGMPPAKLGLAYSIEGILKFIRLIGWGKTKLLFLTGARLSADEAQKIGFIDYLVPRDILEEFTIKIANEILENAPLSIIGFKKILNILGRYELSEEDINRVNEYNEKILKSIDFKEGLKAFLEKRKPIYKGI